MTFSSLPKFTRIFRSRRDSIFSLMPLLSHHTVKRIDASSVVWDALACPFNRLNWVRFLAAQPFYFLRLPCAGIISQQDNIDSGDIHTVLVSCFHESLLASQKPTSCFGTSHPLASTGEWLQQQQQRSKSHNTLSGKKTDSRCRSKDYRRPWSGYGYTVITSDLI